MSFYLNHTVVNIIMMHVDVNKSHVDITDLAYNGHKYATIILGIKSTLTCNHLSFTEEYKDHLREHTPRFLFCTLSSDT